MNAMSYSNSMPSFPSKYHNIDQTMRKITQLKSVTLSLSIQIKVIAKLFEYSSFIKHYMLYLLKIDKYASFQLRNKALDTYPSAIQFVLTNITLKKVC